MNEDEQWDLAVVIANDAIQWVDFRAVDESLPESVPDADRESVYDKVHQLRADGDRHHSMQEMYRYRMLYNAHAAHGWLAAGIPVVKSWRHSDGEECFGGGWFIVTATLPTGQVSNHYEATHWDLFQVPEVDLPPEWDGHTPADAADRLERYLHDCTVDETARGAETTITGVVNLTPHDVVILDADGSEVHRYPRSGEVARLATVELHSHRMPDGVAVQGVEFHHLAATPPRVDGTRYIVSLPTALAAPRADFLVPYGEVRDDSGQIRGVRMLAQPV